MRNEWQGVWHNQWGSQIQLEVDETGRLDGRLLAEGGQATYPLVGFVRGHLIAFSVDFGKHGSLTSWVGHAFTGPTGVRVETLWHMTVVIPHPGLDDERWQSIHSGADVFTRAPTPTVERPRRMPPVPVWLV